MPKRIHKLISKGIINGIKYYIVKNGLYNRLSKKWGIWYCCYVEVPSNIEIYPHGGVTFDGILSILKNNKRVVGWDYNHYNDMTWNDDNFLETRLQVIEENYGIDNVIDILTNDIGGVINEISYENIE